MVYSIYSVSEDLFLYQNKNQRDRFPYRIRMWRIRKNIKRIRPTDQDKGEKVGKPSKTRLKGQCHEKSCSAKALV